MVIKTALPTEFKLLTEMNQFLETGETAQAKTTAFGQILC